MVFAASVLALAAAAFAHVELTSPAQRYPAANQFQLDLKDPPCGRAGNPPGEVERTVFAPGETITVRWDEFVGHPGHFRIAFDPDGDDDLADPAGYDDLYTPGVLVLADGIPHEDGKQFYAYDVTLPDMPCQTCTLQLIQVMTDKPPWGPAGGTDIYYQCADLVLDPAAGTGGAGSSGGGASSGTGGSSRGSSGGGTTGATSRSSGGDSTGGGNGSSGSSGSGSSPAGEGGTGGCGCAAPTGAPVAPRRLLVLLALLARRRRPELS